MIDFKKFGVIRVIRGKKTLRTLRKTLRPLRLRIKKSNVESLTIESSNRGDETQLTTHNLQPITYNS